MGGVNSWPPGTPLKRMPVDLPSMRISKRGAGELAPDSSRRMRRGGGGQSLEHGQELGLGSVLGGRHAQGDWALEPSKYTFELLDHVGIEH